ncbi:MAG: hypothetical protein MK289_23445 [Trichodesmium sp. ALOHA_ZT_67]|nr:hypothetical protein [Trichodesmium sp. ALOHA_ZT_67]
MSWPSPPDTVSSPAKALMLLAVESPVRLSSPEVGTFGVGSGVGAGVGSGLSAGEGSCVCYVEVSGE